MNRVHIAEGGALTVSYWYARENRGLKRSLCFRRGKRPGGGVRAILVGTRVDGIRPISVSRSAMAFRRCK